MGPSGPGLDLGPGPGPSPFRIPAELDVFKRLFDILIALIGGLVVAEQRAKVALEADVADYLDGCAITPDGIDVHGRPYLLYAAQHTADLSYVDLEPEQFADEVQRLQGLWPSIDTHLGAAQQLAALAQVAAVFQGMPGAFEKQPLLRVEAGGFTRGDGEELRIEPIDIG